MYITLTENETTLCLKSIYNWLSFIHIQVLLGGQVRSFKQKVESQGITIAEKNATHQKLTAKVDDLRSLCQQANKKMDADALIIQERESTIVEHEQKLSECNDFITFVREREGKIVACIGQLEEYYEAKSQQRCMLFRKNRTIHPAAEIVFGIGKLLIKDCLLDTEYSPSVAQRQAV